MNVDLRIFGEPEPEPENQVVVRLRRDRNNGVICLEAVDASAGARVWCGSLLGLTPSGRIYFFENVDKRLGLELDHKERLLITDQYPLRTAEEV